MANLLTFSALHLLEICLAGNTAMLCVPTRLPLALTYLINCDEQSLLEL